MNKNLITRLLGTLLLIETAAMLPSMIIAFAYGEGDATALVYAMLITLVAALPMRFLSKPSVNQLRAREGLAVVALGWILFSMFGALPFVFSGVFPNFADAFFESVSGFTTTGASVLNDFEHLPHGIAFWRSFTHWIGGMGVLVLTLAIAPKSSKQTSHLMRAESPGIGLSKVVPKLGDTAKILYLIYILLTFAEFVALIIAGMTPFDAIIHAMGTAGTGGFSNKAGSVGEFNSVSIEIIITVFMVLFGINFVVYFHFLTGNWKEVLRNEELHWYLGIFFGAVLILVILLTPYYHSLGLALRYGTFNVATIISTTGFCTVDFDQWPLAAKALIVCIMFVGSCAGSTAGGMKVVRIGMMVKNAKREIGRAFRPSKVEVIRFEHKRVEESTLLQVSAFIFLYILLVVLGAFVISLNGLYDFTTSFTASLTCVSNVGPGLSAIGPSGNFAQFSNFNKFFMSFLMLCGRLELFPILVLFHRGIWRKS